MVKIVYKQNDVTAPYAAHILWKLMIWFNQMDYQNEFYVENKYTEYV